ncbi:cation diffusion facilitator family transporter [Candidatus Amarolinea dominans]|uniref:cation diffusion facilitator family transporter n=1 Tax=Candidatus Amarolinea dominans TaxID=3140696 RepID=UPI0031CC9E1C
MSQHGEDHEGASDLGQGREGGKTGRRFTMTKQVSRITAAESGHAHDHAGQDAGHAHDHAGQETGHAHGDAGQETGHAHDHAGQETGHAHDHAGQEAGHAHDHAGQDAGHAHGDEHGHSHGGGVWGFIQTVFHMHGHGDGGGELVSDSVLTTSREGIRALQWSLVSLLLTAVMQVVIVAISGSVALLADTIHNFADATTAVPLWLAFALNRRQPSRGFTYRYGKAEDLAGAFVVLVIFSSALVIFYETWQKLIHPEPMRNLGWVAAAAIIGFIGNELAAYVRIRTGRRIGSAALVADGLHARTDGLTSLAVLVGAIGAWLGFPLADPLIGALIGVAILFIVRDAARTMWLRLMDAVDPAMVDTVEKVASRVPGVEAVHEPRLRWVGHALWGELHIEVDGNLATQASHTIAEEVRHGLFHALPRLRTMIVHVDPRPQPGADSWIHHAITAHHAQ